MMKHIIGDGKPAAWFLRDDPNPCEKSHAYSETLRCCLYAGTTKNKTMTNTRKRTPVTTPNTERRHPLASVICLCCRFCSGISSAMGEELGDVNCGVEQLASHFDESEMRVVGVVID
jgi:hypothetical protein